MPIKWEIGALRYGISIVSIGIRRTRGLLLLSCWCRFRPWPVLRPWPILHNPTQPNEGNETHGRNYPALFPKSTNPPATNFQLSRARLGQYPASNPFKDGPSGFGPARQTASTSSRQRCYLDGRFPRKTSLVELGVDDD